VYHRIKYTSCDLYGSTNIKTTVTDSIHAQPARADKHQKRIPGRFDTGLIKYRIGDTRGLAGKLINLPKSGSTLTDLPGHCVGCIQCIFTLPSNALDHWFSKLSQKPAKYLAYVEWFTPFKPSPEANNLLYKISKHRVHGEQQASIVPVDLISQSVHLLPKFGPIAPQEWKSSNVLDLCETFYVNPFSDRFSYSNIC
jgi:hypothetical protein